jgi:hypothetical protein
MQSAKAFAGKLVTYLPDRPYTYLLYYRVVGERLSLKNPQQFTQKIQWLKLNGRLERFARFADKYTVRSYVEETVGAKHLIPLIGVWDSVDQIPFDTLPNSFVLKLTKGCGFNYICKDKSSIDIAQVKALLNDWMGQDFYRQEREPQYKPGRQRIIAEAYMEDASGGLTDYKIHCKWGVPQYVQVDTDRFTNHKSQIYYPDWNEASFLNAGEFSETDESMLSPRPKNLKAMLALAAKLSSDFPYVRVDLYSVGSKLYFGELTFTPGSGLVRLEPDAAVEFGKQIDLEDYKQTLPFEQPATRR